MHSRRSVCRSLNFCSRVQRLARSYSPGTVIFLHWTHLTFSFQTETQSLLELTGIVLNYLSTHCIFDFICYQTL